MGIMEYSRKWENFFKEDLPVTSESATSFHVKGFTTDVPTKALTHTILGQEISSITTFEIKPALIYEPEPIDQNEIDIAYNTFGFIETTSTGWNIQKLFPGI